HADAWEDRGNALLLLRRAADALKSFDRAHALRPSNAGTLCNRGHALEALGGASEALENYKRACELDPNHTGALFARALVLRELKRNDEAIACIEKLMTIDPAYGRGTLVDLKRSACDWEGIEEQSEALIREVREQKGVAAPFFFLAISD